MKKNINNHLFSVVLIAVALLSGFLLFSKKTYALSQNTPFGMQPELIEVCCNGLRILDIGHYLSPASNQSKDFIFPWYNMVPLPFVGTGLYMWWNPVTAHQALGDARQGGECIQIASECEASDYVYWEIQKMGTTLN